MDDLISRQAAIDAVNHICPVDTEYDCTLLDRVDVRCVLLDLPSAERKKGEWLEHYSHEDGERDGVECSKCRTHYYFGGQLMNFCPNCGAEMRGEEG